MKGLTLDQGRALAVLLRTHFFTRTDKVAAKMPWGKPHPIEGGDNLDGLILAHVGGPAAPKGKARYGNRKGSTKVESSYYRLGSYTPDADGNTRWLCLDFDGGAGHADSLADPQGAALEAIRTCQSLGLPAYLEQSGGGSGWHVWVFFDPAVSAKDARRLGIAIAPADALLVAGSCADARRACGIEVFPKADKVKKKSGYGNLVWLPWWFEAPDGANEFHRWDGDRLVAFTPDAFETVTSERLAAVLASLPCHTDGQSVTPGAQPPDTVTVSPSDDSHDPAVEAYLNTVKTADSDAAPAPSPWKDWRGTALPALPVESVYGPWLTGAMSGEHWYECRDPDSPSGDKNPSAGVATGTGDAPRGTFHSFRSNANTSVFDFMVNHGLAGSFREALKKVADYSKVPLPDKGGSSTGSSSRPLPLSRRMLPQIVVNNRQFRDVVADTWTAIHAANTPPVVFNRLGELVNVRDSLVKERRIRIISALGEMALYGRLADVADWVREGEDSVVSVNPPKDIARVMEARPSNDLPPLFSLVEGPVFDAQGELICSPGYHRGEALWLDLPDHFDLGEIPVAPTSSDLAWACSLLLDDLLVDFPFVDQSDRAHAVAALILPFVRRMIPGRTPIHLIEAAEAGSGKGLICHAVSILATGEEMTATTLPGEDDEIRKKLTSELATGRPIIVLDNADDRHSLHSPSLASVITAETWTDRVLGRSSMITVPNDAVWLMTGNNPRLSMELARRCIRIRILSRSEHPHLEDGFKHDPLNEWVKEYRAPLVKAILVLVRAWIAAGKPSSKSRLGSFERWAQTIGGILEIAGIPGFLGNLNELYETADAEGEAWREFVTTWWDTYRDTPLKVNELNDLCESHDLLISVRGDGSPRSQQSRLGRALLAKRDRVFAGRRIVRVGRNGKDKGTRYGLIETETNGSGGSDHAEDDLFDGGKPVSTGNQTIGGTCRTWRNLEPQNAGSSAAVSTGNQALGGTCGTWRNILTPLTCGAGNSCAQAGAHYIGTRAGVNAPIGVAGAEVPPCSANLATNGIKSEILGGTLGADVPPNRQVPREGVTTPITTPPATPSTGSIDLADYDDEEGGMQ